jgi:hypothetical protein
MKYLKKISYKRIIINFLYCVYRLNLSVVFTLIFFFFYTITLNFNYCLEQAKLLTIFNYGEVIFLFLSILSIILNLMFINIIKKKPIIIKDQDIPSRIGEFKDVYLIYPFLTMTIIGIVKILFILLIPFCKINTNINWLTYIILIITGIVSFYMEEIFKKVNNKIKISFFTFSVITLFILFIFLTYSLDPSILGFSNNFSMDSSKENDKNINIMIYTLLFYVGLLGLVEIKSILKKQNSQYKLFRINDLKLIIFYIFILVIIMVLHCIPGFIKKILIFLSCIKNNM